MKDNLDSCRIYLQMISFLCGLELYFLFVQFILIMNVEVDIVLHWDSILKLKVLTITQQLKDIIKIYTYFIVVILGLKVGLIKIVLGS